MLIPGDCLARSRGNRWVFFSTFGQCRGRYRYYDIVIRSLIIIVRAVLRQPEGACGGGFSSGWFIVVWLNSTAATKDAAPGLYRGAPPHTHVPPSKMLRPIPSLNFNDPAVAKVWKGRQGGVRVWLNKPVIGRGKREGRASYQRWPHPSPPPSDKGVSVYYR